MIKGPMRLRKEEGLQMAVREGEQSTETRRKEKKPNLLWPRGSNVAYDGVRVSWEVANQSVKVFKWEWSEWEWKCWEWEISKVLNFRVFGTRQWLKDLTTSIFLIKKTMLTK